MLDAWKKFWGFQTNPNGKAEVRSRYQFISTEIKVRRSKAALK
jgi:hypothetical protein